MLYNPPTGAATVNDAYIGKNVAAGIIGSKLPPKAAEAPQREIVNAEMAAGLSPTNGDFTQLAQAMSIGLWLGQMGGTANAITDALPALATTSDGVTQFAIPSLQPGMTFHGIIPATNTGPATLTLTGFGTAPGGKLIVRKDGTPLQAGDLVANALVSLKWDGTAYRVTGAVASDVSNAYLIGTDSGAAGAIAVTAPLPAVAALKVGTTLVTVPKAVNAGPTTIALTTAAGVVTAPVIYPSSSPLLGGEMQARPQVFIYDGVSWEWQGQQSPVLQQTTSFYVNGSTSNVTSNGITYGPGSDTNNGLTPATPFKTIQKAASFVSGVNVNGQGVTVNVADGTYAPFSYSGAVNGSVSFIGDPAAPSNCVITTSTLGTCVSATNGTQITLNGFRIVNTLAAGLGLYSNRYSFIYFSNIDFGPCGQAHNFCDVGTINCVGNYTISGAAQAHVSLSQGTFIQTPSYANTVTITGTPLFSVAYLVATNGGFFRANTNTTFSGTARGYRYSIAMNAEANVSGAGANFLPGDAAGATATGGEYA